MRVELRSLRSRLSIELPQWLQLVDRGRRTCARSSSARRSRGRPSAARSGAGSTRSGSGPARFVGRSQGSSQPGHSRPTTHRALAIRASSVASARDKEAVGAVAVRERRGTQPVAGQTHLLARRDRARRVDEPAAGRERGARRGEDRAPARGASGSIACGRHAPARVGARCAACRGRCTAGRRARGRRAAERVGGIARRRRRAPDARRAHARAPCARARAARRGWRSTATTSPRSPISAARCVVLPPGAAHRSSTRSPGCGSSDARDALRARDCGVIAPRGVAAGGARTSNGPSTIERVVLARGRRAGRPRRAGASVLTRSASSAGSLSAASSARVSSAPSQSHHSATIHSGCEWRDRGALRGCRRRAARRRSRCDRRSTALTSSAPPAARLGQLDRLGDRGVGRHASRNSSW